MIYTTHYIKRQNHMAQRGSYTYLLLQIDTKNVRIQVSTSQYMDVTLVTTWINGKLKY